MNFDMHLCKTLFKTCNCIFRQYFLLFLLPTKPNKLCTIDWYCLMCRVALVLVNMNSLSVAVVAFCPDKSPPWQTSTLTNLPPDNEDIGRVRPLESWGHWWGENIGMARTLEGCGHWLGEFIGGVRTFVVWGYIYSSMRPFCCKYFEIVFIFKTTEEI